VALQLERMSMELDYPMTAQSSHETSQSFLFPHLGWGARKRLLPPVSAAKKTPRQERQKLVSLSKPCTAPFVVLRTSYVTATAAEGRRRARPASAPREYTYGPVQGGDVWDKASKWRRADDALM